MRARRLFECFRSPREDETESLVCSMHVLSRSLSSRERAKGEEEQSDFRSVGSTTRKLSNVASRRESRRFPKMTNE